RYGALHRRRHHAEHDDDRRTLKLRLYRVARQSGSDAATEQQIERRPVPVVGGRQCDLLMESPRETNNECTVCRVTTRQTVLQDGTQRCLKCGTLLYHNVMKKEPPCASLLDRTTTRD